eukprot:3186094-Ditylum_brightwellii.AAC.1
MVLKTDSPAAREVSSFVVANMSDSPRCTVMSDPSRKSTLSIDAIPPEMYNEKRKMLNCEASRQYREKKRRENTHLTTN